MGYGDFLTERAAWCTTTSSAATSRASPLVFDEGMNLKLRTCSSPCSTKSSRTTSTTPARSTPSRRASSSALSEDNVVGHNSIHDAAVARRRAGQQRAKPQHHRIQRHPPHLPVGRLHRRDQLLGRRPASRGRPARTHHSLQPHRRFRAATASISTITPAIASSTET